LTSKVKITALFALLLIGMFLSMKQFPTAETRFVTCIVDPKKQDLKLYWKDDKNQHFKSIHNLRLWLEKNNKTLEFAMNGGMYQKDNSPQGLYIENHKLLADLDTLAGNGNFFLKPNGVFFITDKNIAGICVSEKFKNKDVKYATQSGPMLLADGKIHAAFKEGSANLNIRNGVGILENGKVVFAMSKGEINFYDFANYFKSMGCKNALYLDGLVSRTYLPSQKWVQTDGNFGVIIGVAKRSDNR